VASFIWEVDIFTGRATRHREGGNFYVLCV